MAVERNEAGWGHTRTQRRVALEQVAAKVREDLLPATAQREALPEDTVAGLLYVALVKERGEIRVSQAVVAYGLPVLKALVEACDTALAQVASNVQAAEVARRESRVKGKKGGSDGVY